jgi:selenium metabolism protein YedF
MAEVVDARGLPCPQPVILTRNAMQKYAEVTTIVDNVAAQGNVTRMARKAGATVRAETRDDGTYLYISSAEPPSDQAAACEAPSAPAGGPLVVVVPSEHMGRGEHDELGQILLRTFFHTLGEVRPLPDTIIFLNSGVKMVVDDSPVLEDLRALRDKGVEVLGCGTCLGYYRLTEMIAVGEVSNMYTIAEKLLGAGKTVSL